MLIMSTSTIFKPKTKWVEKAVEKVFFDSFFK